jgi:hypothetical protein
MLSLFYYFSPHLQLCYSLSRWKLFLFVLPMNIDPFANRISQRKNLIIKINSLFPYL